MRKIEFFDTSLRDGEQTPGVSFSIAEKVTIAKQLEKWGISVIEAGFPAASPDSFEAVKQISKALKETAVTALARCVRGSKRSSTSTNSCFYCHFTHSHEI